MAKKSIAQLEQFFQAREDNKTYKSGIVRDISSLNIFA
jgi:hypothetical protein